MQKKGGGDFGVDNRKILSDVGINPLLSRCNFTWAPINVKGQHGIAPQAELNRRLKEAEGNKDAIIRVLSEWKVICENR